MAQLNLNEGLEQLASRARTASTVVAVTVAGYLGMAVISVLEYLKLIDYEAAALTPLTMVAVAVGLIQVGAFLASIVLVAMWIHRAHENLAEAGYHKQFTPGWAVGWFFVPIANLFQPFRAMRELWNLSHQQADSPHDVAASELSVWWGAWIVGSVLSNFGSREISGDNNFELLVGAAGGGSLAGAAWLLRGLLQRATPAPRPKGGMTDTFA